MTNLNTAISYTLRGVVIAPASLLALLFALFWSRLDVEPALTFVHAEVVLPSVNCGSATLALVLLILEWFTQGDPARRYALAIDTCLAIGWLLGVAALTIISVSSAVP